MDTMLNETKNNHIARHGRVHPAALSAALARTERDGSQRRLARPADWRPETASLTRAEMRRIVAEMIG
jgi:hypothetical protein